VDIYLSGIYHSGIAKPGSRSIHLRMMERVRHPFVMESFHYADDATARLIRYNKQKIFLDSGAFSAHMQGVRINLRQYAAFISENADIIKVAANLDLIGPGNERWSYQRQKSLETLLTPDGLDRLIIPVHHVRDHDDWLRRYLDEGYSYIGLGGMVGESPRILKRWLDHVWRRYLTYADGTPKVKVHGFGLTSRELMRRYRWASVDSTSWMRIAHYGGVLLDFAWSNGSIGDFKIEFSERSPKRFDPNSWHYHSLMPADKRAVDLRLEQLEAERIRDPEIEADFQAELGCKMGFNPTALGRSYGLRDLCNIGYYLRAMQRSQDQHKMKCLSGARFVC
jgi:hypothetical protein